MKKRIGFVLLALCLCLCKVGAYADAAPRWAEAYTTPELGTAVTFFSTRLTDAPADDAKTLMRYEGNIRVEVLELHGDYVYVRVGDEDEGNLTGYMKANELGYGEDAARAAGERRFILEAAEDVTVYAQMDDLAPQIGDADLRWSDVLGVNDEWLHIRTGDFPPKTGFVKRQVDFKLIQNDVSETSSVQPKEDELSIEDAVEEAKKQLVNGDFFTNGTGDLVEQALLDACTPYVDCTYTLHSKPEHLLYSVDFVSTEDMRAAGIPEIYAYIILIVEKGQVVDVWLGNG